MPLNRNKFFQLAKEGLFSQYSQNQINGINFLLDYWEASGLKDLRWLAYILATVYHETAKTFQPIKEYGNLTYLRGKKYWPYYGRGYVQLTWDYNYKKMQELWNSTHSSEQVDLLKNPDLAQQPRLSVFILFEGMTKGLSSKGDFTGKSLEDYFNNKLTDWYNARKIINGLDKAKLISEIAQKMYLAVRVAAGEKTYAERQINGRKTSRVD